MPYSVDSFRISKALPAPGKADLQNIDLFDTYLRRAHLEEADLRETELRQANLTDARLDRAKLEVRTSLLPLWSRRNSRRRI